jgi:hypothetical protein
MEKKRKVYAPFSLTSEAGVAQTPVEGYIDVNQVIYPTVSTGTVNENGKWTGVKSNDSNFIGFSRAEAIPNGGVALFPDSNNHPSINMEGFRHLQFAIRANADNASISLNAVTGPDTILVDGLSPVNAGFNCRFMSASRYLDETFDNVMNDTAEALGTADEWCIFTVLDRFIGQSNVQVKITNADGANRNYEFAYRRLV